MMIKIYGSDSDSVSDFNFNCRASPIANNYEHVTEAKRLRFM